MTTDTRRSESAPGKKRLRMDWKLLATVFGTTFLAELGDKTQLALITFTCSNRHPLSVFLGGSLALVVLRRYGRSGRSRGVPAWLRSEFLHIAAALGFIVSVGSCWHKPQADAVTGNGETR